MQEQFRNQMALMATEAMYMLWELGHQEDERDVDAMMRRLKDLSAYLLTHAEILDLKEGVEMLAIAMFFGATSNARLHKNQERLKTRATIRHSPYGEDTHLVVANRTFRHTSGFPSAIAMPDYCPFYRIISA